MPFGIEKRGSKFVVVNKDTGRVLGTHAAREKAGRQIQAIEANMKKDVSGRQRRAAERNRRMR